MKEELLPSRSKLSDRFGLEVRVTITGELSAGPDGATSKADGPARRATPPLAEPAALPVTGRATRWAVLLRSLASSLAIPGLRQRLHERGLCRPRGGPRPRLLPAQELGAAPA